MRYYGSAVSGPDGRWTITGVPPGSQYLVDVGCSFPAAQVLGAPPCVASDETWHSEATGAFYTQPIVANQIVQIGDIALTRAITITSPSSAAVTAGPLALSWSAIPGAAVYCVILADQTANALLRASGATCGPGDLAWAATATTSWTSPPLVAGHAYASSVYALDRPADASFIGLCFAQPSATFTCLGHGETNFIAH